jgi:hypothetical protein
MAVEPVRAPARIGEQNPAYRPTRPPPPRAPPQKATIRKLGRPCLAEVLAYARWNLCVFVRERDLEEWPVKLGEALVERADAVRRVEQLRTRIKSSARYQEGETPAEDAAQLLAESGAALDWLESLIRRINRTNAAVSMGEDGTLTDALARRDVLRLRHAVTTAAADAAAGKDQRGFGRQMRSELMMIAALPVAELRAQADGLARDIRELDMRIQRTNWEVDLLD